MAAPTDGWGTLALDGGEILGLEPRLRGAEVVSPLEGTDAGHALPSATLADGAVHFGVTAEANPNNSTSATQGIALHLRADPATVIRANLSGDAVSVPVSRLLEGALSGNLGPIDSPAWRLHALPRPADWQWHGRVPLGEVGDGENIYLRLRQRGGQMAWTSPIFCRN